MPKVTAGTLSGARDFVIELLSLEIQHLGELRVVAVLILSESQF